MASFECYILCSARTRNLCNPRIAQCKLEIHTLPRNPGIAQPIPLLRIRDIDTSRSMASYKNAMLDQECSVSAACKPLVSFIRLYCEL